MTDITIFGFRGSFARHFIETAFNNCPFVGVEKTDFPLSSDTRQKIRSSKMLLFCVPYSATRDILKTIEADIQPHHTLVDIASVKSNLYNLDRLRAQTIVSLHPLYSPTTDLASRPCVFCNIRGVLTDTRPLSLFTTIKKMTVEEHDRAMAIVQAAVHFQNYVTANFLKSHKVNEKTHLYSILHSVIERQMRQDATMMAEIQVYNPYVRETLQSLKQSFDNFLDAVSSGDTQRVVEYIEASKIV